MKNKDILLKDNKNNNLYPLAHQDYNQHILDEFYFGIHDNLPPDTDLNNIKKPGTHWLAPNTTYYHAPGPWNTPSNSTYGLLIVYKSRYGYDRRLIQEVIKVGASTVNTYYRYCNTGNTWVPENSWLEPAGSGGDQGDITSVYGGGILTGGGTSGSITITHKTPATSPEKTTQGLYPITIDSYGHITTTGAAQTIPTESTVSGWGFTKNVGTITGVSLNGTSVATFGVANIVLPEQVTVDSNFSTTSENPLQNKIITNNLNGRMMGYVPSNSSLNVLVSAGIYYISEANSSGIAVATNADDSDLSSSDKENSSLWPRPYPTFSINLSTYPYWGYLIVEKISSNDSSDANNQVKQTLWSIDSSNKKTGWACFFRVKLASNKWTKWHKIADEDWPINSIQDSDIDHIMIDDLVSSLED